MADQENPVFQIQRVYLKDMSLEQPNSPAILIEQEQPSVDIQLGHGGLGVRNRGQKQSPPGGLRAGSRSDDPDYVRPR